MPKLTALYGSRLLTANNCPQRRHRALPGLLVCGCCLKPMDQPHIEARTCDCAEAKRCFKCGRCGRHCCRLPKYSKRRPYENPMA